MRWLDAAQDTAAGRGLARSSPSTPGSRRRTRRPPADMLALPETDRMRKTVRLAVIVESRDDDSGATHHETVTGLCDAKRGWPSPGVRCVVSQPNGQ